jgi:ubiquinone/menaquinone biosynthesis C-methylase UbiE
MNPSIAFDRAADYYDNTRGFPASEEKGVTDVIRRVGQIDQTSRVLEIGVGTGRIALPLAAQVGTVVGIDLSRPMLERLRAKRNRERVEVVQGDATQLPFRSHSFDAALAVHVFHLIPAWQDVIGELARVLRAGAPLIHCWTEGDQVFKNLWDGWRSAIPEQKAEDVGVRWERNPTLPQELGWTPVGEAQFHTYTREQSPAQFLNALQNHIWSQTWRLSDEDLTRGAAAVQAIIAREYPDPERPVQAESKFYAQAYTPPR